MSMTLESRQKAAGTAVNLSWNRRTVGAYVLIEATVGMVEHVEHDVAELGVVTESHLVAGPYDVIARVECAEVDELGKLVLETIRGIAGVTRALTCPIIS